MDAPGFENLREGRIIVNANVKTRQTPIYKWNACLLFKERTHTPIL